MVEEKRLNRSEIFNIFNNIESDLSMLVQENMVAFNAFLSYNSIQNINDISESMFKEITRAKEFYGLLESKDTVTIQSFINFLNSLYEDMKKVISQHKEITIVENSLGEKITTHVFFMVFMKIIIVMQISIIMGEAVEEKMDSLLLEEEYNRMKREGLI
jgi:hypothetical protein